MKKIVLMLIVLLVVSSSQAVLTFEANYDTNEDLSVGNPANGTLLVDATVSGGALNVPGVANSGASYGPMNPSPFDFTNGSSWGSNTVVGIFTLDSAALERQILFSLATNDYTYGYSAAYGMNFWINDASNRPAFQLYDYWGSTGLVDQQLAVYTPPLVTNKKFFVAASWNDNGDGTVSTSIYLREADDMAGTTAMFVDGVSTTPGVPSSWDDVMLFVGARPNGSNTTLIEQAKGDIDLVQVYAGEWMVDAGDYDTLYTNVIPEPATLSLLALSGMLMIRKRR